VKRQGEAGSTQPFVEMIEMSPLMPSGGQHGKKTHSEE